jgi:lipoteichoic acid synthase
MAQPVPPSGAEVSTARHATAIAGIAGLGMALAGAAMASRGRLTETLSLVDLPDHLHAPLSFLLAIGIGAYYDFIFIGALTVVFMALAYAARRHPALLRSVTLLYVVLGALTLLLGFANITIVDYLGTPVTWQWITYSDSLESLDARNSLLGIAANLSGKMLVASAGVVLAVATAALLFRWLFLAAARRYTARAVLAGAAAAAAIYLGFGYWYLGKLDYNHSKVANPVFAFARSLLGERTPALLTMATAASSADFATAATRPPPAHARAEGAALSGGTTAPRNVLLFVFESVPQRYIETYGGSYPVTPTLAKYRSEAVQFENIYATSPNTQVSLVSLLTGTYPWLAPHFVTQDYPAIRLHSLSGELKRRGYRTAAFGSADFRYLGADQFLAHHDIDLQRDYRSIPCATPAKLATAGALLTRLVGQHSLDAVNDNCTADALTKWIGEAPQQPFFALLWTDMTHHPYAVSGKEVDYGTGNPSLNRYLNALREGDRALGRIMQALEAAGLDRSTLVVVLGDHGEAFGTHGQVVHASNIYEENVHIPLLFIDRSLFHGETSSVIGGMSDIAPTILELLHLPEPGDWQGASLLSARPSPRTYFFTPWADLKYGYRERDRKVIFNATTNQYAVYDLARDPGETRNIVDESPISRQEITGHIAAWVQYQDRMMRHLVAPAPPGEDGDVGLEPASTHSFGVGREAVLR